MSRFTVILLLLFAALLEAGGDAVIRASIRSPQGWFRVFLFASGACLLIAYGWFVNTSSWNFGRAIGLYVVFFFLVAQFISWAGFGQLPSRGLLIGGILIVSGGLVITFLE